MKNVKYFLLLGLIALTGIQAISPTDSEGYSVGDTADDFELLGVDGKMHSLSEMEDVEGYVVIFTCNHCPFAVAYEDRIIALHHEYAEKGYPVVAINPNDPEIVPADSYENMKKRAEEKDFPFHYLIDEGQKVYPKYGATKTPHVYLLDKNRVVQYIGAIDNNARNPEGVTETYLADAIDALANGSKPDPNFTKAVGCSVKCSK